MIKKVDQQEVVKIYNRFNDFLPKYKFDDFIKTVPNYAQKKDLEKANIQIKVLNNEVI